ncbi:MAG: DAK2 domain-containing protein [Anaerolineae bacterium]|nr:DAK2 domain-containing protein [Anaerolineae bacterium]
MSVPDGDTLRALDGVRLKPMISAALAWLRQHQDAINALNVFPVPDGDTGTNMNLTMVSAWDEIAEVDEPHVGRLMTKLAHGALMGARGNSGVILSQIWRGFAHGVDGHGRITVETMVEAMRAAADTAYKGVVKPVEGTILTVVREMAEEAALAAEQSDDMIAMFDRLVRRAGASVARTPTLLPVLRQAGVVDSGGQGLYVIFEGMLRDLKGLPVAAIPTQADLAHLQLEAHPQGGAAIEFDSAYPYDVQLIILGTRLDVPLIRSGIEAMGDCPLTVGDEVAVKIHVHVADPGAPISFGARFGSVTDVVVEDMRVQYEAYTAERDAARSGPPLPAALLGQAEPAAISVVVVSTGQGLADVFYSLGATVVIEGGQTMNPSTAQLVEAVSLTASENVIILPNNPNILMTAQQAAQMADGKQVRVVPTRTIPQGVAAMLALDQDAALEENATAMYASSSGVITAEVTSATRNVRLNGIEVREGDAIGLLEDELVVDANTFEEAVRWLLAEAEIDDRELVTLYFGQQVTEDQANALVEELSGYYPDLEFEVVNGGQPHYPYILSIE